MKTREFQTLLIDFDALTAVLCETLLAPLESDDSSRESQRHTESRVRKGSGLRPLRF